MSALPFERLCSMGAFEGLRALRQQAESMPGLGVSTLIEIIRRVDADAAGLDFDAALELEGIVESFIPPNPAAIFYQACLAAVILEHRMSWSRAVTRGRATLLAQLSRDERQCFREAHLLHDLPSPEALAWWDRISGEMRTAIDQQKRAVARQAERLTIDYELQRLKTLGITFGPKWVALDDNGAGYDVLSYDLGEKGPVNRLIEVKSTVASPLRFFVSRNEWEIAASRGESYCFHVWDMARRPPFLYERSVAQVQPHIPSDNENGRWSIAEIPVGAL